GCNTSSSSDKQIKEATAKQTVEQKKAKAVEIPLTQGVITWDPYEYNAQNTTLYTKDLRDSFKQVRYNIWRTADGPESKQTFTSQ
ncbi:polysaccharide deacetylase, partial [Bacillus thuringiensis]